MTEFHLFPYHLVEKGSRIVLYGAGAVMRCYVHQLQTTPYCEIICAVDRNYEMIKAFRHVKVFSPSTIKELSFDTVVIATSLKLQKSVKEDLLQLGVLSEKIIHSDYHAIGYSPEALVIKNIFDYIDVKKPTYLDVGAHHPDWLSNTSLFYDNGSRGINVEADSSLMNAFIINRSEDLNINIGIAPQKGFGVLHLFENKALNTFDETVTKYYSDGGYSSEDAISVELITINDVVDKYNDGKFPDFLDMDIEGLDFDVLENCDFSKSSPMVICVEVSGEKGHQLNKILSEKECTGGGYLLYCRIFPNSIYVRKDILPQLLELNG